jgi:2,3-bisphosphoglycerate-independent phosphoglycerate mutase
VGRVVEATLNLGGALIITADHGNADVMVDYQTGTPWTAHTTNPVPIYFVVPELADARLRSGGILADIAPSALQALGLPIPADMTGRTLVEG